MIQRIQNSKWVFVLISVFLAVIFWMYVRNDLDPPGSRTIYNVPVTLRLSWRVRGSLSLRSLTRRWT